MMYHVTVFNGRADTFHAESENHTNIINFLKKYSNTNIINIKKVLFQNPNNEVIETNEDYYNQVCIHVKTKNFSDMLIFNHVKKTITNDDLLTICKTMSINNELIEDIYNIVYF